MRHFWRRTSGFGAGICTLGHKIRVVSPRGHGTIVHYSLYLSFSCAERVMVSRGQLGRLHAQSNARNPGEEP
jgi:hypothetical protein